MASIHEVRIPEDLKADIAEMMLEKKAAKQSSVGNPNLKGGQSFQAYTEASMRNRVPGKLTLINSNNYSGKPIGPYPSEIERNRTQGFDHKGTNTNDPDGSMGCVVYSGYNHDGVGQVECAWLMAWHVGIGGTDCKVYVEAGLKAPYQSGTLDWDKVKQKLEKSSATSYYKDQATGAEVSAQIDLSGETAELAAVFKVAN